MADEVGDAPPPSAPPAKYSQNQLRVECPHPVTPSKVCDTLVVNPKITQFLTKLGWNPKRGLESALRSCQEKLLDIFGPLTKLFELAEGAKADNSPIDPHELSCWFLRAICITCNVNKSIERRKAILFKGDPKLSNLSLTEAGKKDDGLLFGNSFVK